MAILPEVGSAAIEITLDAVIVAVSDGVPRLLTVDGPDGLPALPSGLLEAQDRTLEVGLRRWVSDQTGLEIGYIEQLYTFGDRIRSSHLPPADAGGPRRLSIAYLALVREERPAAGASWHEVYDFFGWEDHRDGRPAVIDERILPALDRYVTTVGDREEQTRRVTILFGSPGAPFDGIRTLERYELLHEAGLVFEAGPDRVGGALLESRSMHLDHRRIAATALGRLRGKLTYRPVVFELLPTRFTLLQLQQVVEALAGVRLHKGNFRRLVESGGLVEGTGDLAPTGGRPAELFRFRPEVVGERPRPGVGMPWTRT